MIALEDSDSQMIDDRIRELDDWRGSVLKRMRELIHEAGPRGRPGVEVGETVFPVNSCVVPRRGHLHG